MNYHAYKSMWHLFKVYFYVLLSLINSFILVKAEDGSFVGCWYTKNMHKNRPYSATYCFEGNGRLTGSFTENGDGSDFLGNWEISEANIINIKLDGDPKIICRYKFNVDKNLFTLDECTEKLLNGNYLK